MKRILSFLLLAAVLLSCWGNGLAESNPLVYRVTDDEGHQIYLLGTIHVGMEDTFPLGPAAEEAYEASDVLAVEMDVDLNLWNFLDIFKMSAALVYTNGDSAENHLSPETYALGVEMLGYPEFILKRMKPVAWYSLAENYAMGKVNLSAEWGVDDYLIKRAKKDKKTIVELEGMDSQLSVMDSFPDLVMDYEIQILLTCPEEASSGTAALYEAWKAGDAEAMVALTTEESEAPENALDDLDESQLEVYASLMEAYAEFNDLLIDSRNGGFLQQAVDYLQSGQKALIAIGALHIVGETGLANQLAQAGYHVEIVGR